MSKKLIIVDSDHPLVRNNKCFELSEANTGCGHWINVSLGIEAKKKGFDIVTGDVYLSMVDTKCVAFCLTDMISANTNLILKKGAIPAVCYSLESPLMARKFYHNMKKYAGRFRHNYQFAGAKERLVKTNTKFHGMNFPMDSYTSLPIQAWNNRKYLILVNSNKRSLPFRFDSLLSTTKTIFGRLRFGWIWLLDPTMRIREIYKDRIEAINYFANNPGFHLYGIGWNQPIPGFNRSYYKAAIKAYKGPLDYLNKRKTLNSFKFAICFENCSFPGYITEKIFDCFLSGCIPVYYGAPDITDFVPANCFIDFRKFNNMADLDHYLAGMSESEALCLIEAAQNFLKSDAYTKFYQDTFVNEIMEILTSLS